MPFEKIPPSGGKRYQAENVAMSALIAKKGATVQLSIYFSNDVAVAAGFEDGTKINILEGIDDDAGSMLFERTDDKRGYTLYGTKQASSFNIRLMVAKLQHYELNEAPCPYTHLQYTADKATGILVQLPSWLHYKHKPVAIRKGLLRK
jgi:hypothetical protein